MEFLEPREHKLLAYVEAVQRQGYTLNWEQFEAFASNPTRSRGRTQLRLTRNIAAGVVRALSTVPVDIVEPPETTLDFFLRVGWIHTDPVGERVPDSPVEITGLGTAVLRHADAEAGPDEAELTIVLDPSDPFSYARVIGRIADLGESMLVDPYFGLDELTHIAFRTSVTRVLTSYAKQSELAALATALETINLERPFAIRVAGKGQIHDRYVLSDSGRVHFIGTSLSGVGKKPSAMGEIHGVAAEALTKLHEEIWNVSEELAGPDDEPR